MARRYLYTLNQVEPGLTRNRGKTLYELVDVNLYLVQSRYRTGDIGRDILEQQCTGTMHYGTV